MRIGQGTKIIEPVNIYGCIIGEDCFVGPFVEIQKGAIIGDRTRIQSHSFVCSGVRIGDNVFIGHGVMFINDKHPVANSLSWKMEETVVESEASIGSNATILCGVTIGEGAMVGAGSVVTKDVQPWTTVAGNPAREIKTHES